jgi:iron complex transport system substrate-binding protein
MNSKHVKIFCIFSVLAVMIVGTMMAGCTGSQTATATPTVAPTTVATTKTITDQSGANVTVPYPVSTIAVPVIVNEWALVILGVEDKQIAGPNNLATSAALLAYNPGFANISAPFSDWSATGVNVETLLAAKPDVVIMDPSDPRIPTVNGTGIPVLQVSYTDNMSEYISVMGSLFGGNAEKLADSYVSWHDGMIQNISAKISTIPESQRTKFLRAIYWNGEWSATTPGLTVKYADAGGVNVVPANSSLSVTEEQAIKYAMQADVIITNNAATIKQIESDPAWQNVPAVKNNRIYLEPSGMGAYGSFTPEGELGIVWAANVFYPSTFNNSGMSTISQMKYFYPTFYHYNINATEINETLSGQGFVPIASEMISK